MIEATTEPLPATWRMRRVLRLNVAFTTISAVVLVVFAAPIAELLGTDRVGLVRIVGLALAAFAVDVWLLSRARASRLAGGTRLVALADFAWVAASVLTVALGWYAGAGNVAVLAVAAIVGALGVAELRAATVVAERRLTSTEVALGR